MKHPRSQYIVDRTGFQTFCDTLRKYPRFALDTEFVGEDRYTPKLELIQIGTEDLAAVIDVPAVDTLDELGDLLYDPAIEKVVHAGRQDMELFFHRFRRWPKAVFDTQLAAALVGYGAQVAYGTLVSRVLGVKLEKSHTLSNWSHRPLTDEQLIYAAEDVHYLLPVYRHLHDRLTVLDRMEWIAEESARAEIQASELVEDPRTRYQRIRGWDSLRPKTAAILRELVVWREAEARQRNVPRGWIARDDILLEIARRQPQSLPALRAVRGLSAGDVERKGEAILAAVRKGLACPPSDWPVIPKPSKPDPDQAGVVELLQAVLKACALEQSIAPSLLAGSADLQLLADTVRDRDQLDLPILKGWRRKLAGDRLLRVLEGRVTVSIDPTSGKPRLIDREPSRPAP